MHKYDHTEQRFTQKPYLIFIFIRLFERYVEHSLLS